MRRTITTADLPTICLQVTDGTHDSPALQPSGVPFIKGKHISSGRIDFEACDFISEEDHAKCIRRVKPQPDDVLFANIGSIGDVARVTDEREFSIKNVALFRPDPRKVDRTYFYYLVTSAAFRGVFLNTRSGAAQPFFRLEAFRSHRFPFNADKSEQQAIGSILSAYDDLIENNRRRMALLEEAARQLYREWFVRLRFPGHEHTRIANGVPEGWEKRRVEDLAELMGGKQLDGERIVEEGPVPVFGGNGIQGYTTEKTHDGFVIAFGRVGANCGSVHWSYDGAWINNNASGVVPNEYPELFLHHLLNFDFTSLRKGAAQPFIPNGVLAAVEFWRSPRTIAELFCEAVQPLRLQQANLARANRKLRAARDLLLPRLMSGEIAV